MNRHGPGPALHILQGESHELQPGFVEKIKVAVRQSGVNQRGSGVDDKPQVRMLLWQARTSRAGRHSRHYILFSSFSTQDRTRNSTHCTALPSARLCGTSSERFLNPLLAAFIHVSSEMTFI